MKLKGKSTHFQDRRLAKVSAGGTHKTHYIGTDYVDELNAPPMPSEIGSQQAANGSQWGPTTLSASSGPKVTPQDRADAISDPVKGGDFLRKHGLG